MNGFKMSGVFPFARISALLIFPMLASGNEPEPVKIALAKSKSAKILDASVTEVPRSVVARISFYEITTTFSEIDKSLAGLLRSKIVAGNYVDSDPFLMGRTSAWFIVEGLSPNGPVMLALSDGNTIFFRGCSAFSSTAYQNDERSFGDGSTRDLTLWKSLSDLADLLINKQ